MSTERVGWTVCPHCNGARRFPRLVPPGPFDDAGAEVDASVIEYDDCSVCRGEGSVPSAQAAVYKARGGPAPTGTSVL